jgi:hypothetical protein
MTRSLHWTLAAIMLAINWQASAQQQVNEPKLVINPDRPYLYVQFDHFGTGEPRSENEAPNRVWLRLVNNCTVTAGVHVNGFPADHRPADEVAIMDRVVKDEERLVTVARPADKAEKADQTPPFGYWFDVGSIENIPPGKSIVFSLPTNQFRQNWHIEIPYEFALPTGKGPRPDDIGGQPIMYVTYALWWLPKDIQQKIEKENDSH